MHATLFRAPLSRTPCMAMLNESERRFAPTRRVLIGIAGSLALRPLASPAAAASPMEAVLENPDWPSTFPFRPDDFERYDERQDAEFYSAPRFVTHIDDPAITALTKHLPFKKRDLSKMHL